MATRDRAKRRAVETAQCIVITSDLVEPPTIMGWERELLLPVVGMGKLVADLVQKVNEADAKEAGTPSP